MSASPRPPFKLYDVLSALNARIEKLRRNGGGPPLEGLATKPEGYLIENLEMPLPPWAYEALKPTFRWLDGDLDDLEFRTFTGSGSTSLLHPKARAPMGLEGTIPLRVVAHNSLFPADYNPERPCLIYVRPPDGFQSITDCQNLRLMDAILTILHLRSPKFLEKAFAKPYDFDCRATVEFDRYAGRKELFDLQIECFMGGVRVSSSRAYSTCS